MGIIEEILAIYQNGMQACIPKYQMFLHIKGVIQFRIILNQADNIDLPIRRKTCFLVTLFPCCFNSIVKSLVVLYDVTLLVTAAWHSQAPLKS